MVSEAHQFETCNQDLEQTHDTGGSCQDELVDSWEEAATGRGEQDESNLHLVLLEMASGDEVTDESVKNYTKSVENLQKNGATTKETVESFKRAVKALKDFDQKALERELEKGAKNKGVDSLIVLMHLKEVLEKNGFTVIASQLNPKDGSVILKNPKTETYISMQFSKAAGKEGAVVTIENKGPQ